MRRPVVWGTVLAVALTLVSGAMGLAQESPKPPQKPNQPFTVYLFTEGLTNEHVDMPRVTEEVSKRVAKKNKWFKVVKQREGADFVVEVLTHAVNEQSHTILDMRVDLEGVGKNWYEHTYVVEQHRIESRVTLRTGAQKILTGSDEKRKGGTLERAASNLADELEAYCKESYWDLVSSE